MNTIIERENVTKVNQKCDQRLENAVIRFSEDNISPDIMAPIYELMFNILTEKAVQERRKGA